MKKKRIYLSGKIAGLPQEDVKTKFALAEVGLQETWEVVNPYEIMRLEDFSWADYMLRDLMYLKHCDAIYMMSDWEDSPGAKVELAFAKGLGIEIIYQEED